MRSDSRARVVCWRPESPNASRKRRRPVRNAITAYPLPAAPWQRHDLLRIAPDAWACALAARPAFAALPLLTNWVMQEWPVIVRRRMEGDDPALVPVGVPLPPAAGKLRIALSVPAQAVI